MKNIRTNSGEQGYLMLGVLGLITIVMILSANVTTSSNDSIKAASSIKLINTRYYKVEAAISDVVNWMQDNSEDLGNYFDPTFFESNFEIRDDEALIGDNEVANFGVPSRIKVAGTDNSTAMISNNDEFGESAFPTVGGFDPIASFQAAFPNADNGGVNMRVSLVWAEGQGTDPYGPVFRIDAITGNNPDRGIHLYSNIVGRTTITTPEGDGGVPGAYEIDPDNDYTGFYNHNASNTVTFIGASNCNSKPWTFNGTSWNSGANQNSCYIASQGAISLSGAGTKIFGAVYTGLSFTDVAKVTSFDHPGDSPDLGSLPNGLNGSCRTGNCTGIANPLLEFDQDNDGTVTGADYPWSHFCGSSTAVPAKVGGVLTLSAGCYDTVDVSGGTLNLVTLRGVDDSLDGHAGTVSKLDITRSRTPYNNNTSTGYYIRNLNLTSNAVLRVDMNNINSAIGDKKFADVYVENLGRISGRTTINAGNAPHKLRLSVMNDFEIASNNADVNAHFIVPKAGIRLTGGRNYHGNIHAYNLFVAGNANLFGDSKLTGGYAVNDLVEDTAPGSTTPPTYGVIFDSYKISQKFR